jgi:hypothetical protein
LVKLVGVGFFVLGLVFGRCFDGDVFVHFLFHLNFLNDLFLFNFNLGFFGRSFGRFFRFLLFFCLILEVLVEFLGVFVVLNLILAKVKIANSQEVGELSVVKVHIRLVLVIQTLKEHGV